MSDAEEGPANVIMTQSERCNDQSMFAAATDALPSKPYLTPGPTPKLRAILPSTGSVKFEVPPTGNLGTKRKRPEISNSTYHRQGKRQRRLSDPCPEAQAVPREGDLDFSYQFCTVLVQQAPRKGQVTGEADDDDPILISLSNKDVTDRTARSGASKVHNSPL